MGIGPQTVKIDRAALRALRDDRNKARDAHFGSFLRQIVEARALDGRDQQPDIGLAGFGACLRSCLVCCHQRNRAFVEGVDLRVPLAVVTIENLHTIIDTDAQDVAKIMRLIAGEGERLVCRKRLVYKQALNGFGFACHAFIPYHIIIAARDIIGQSDKRKFEMTPAPPQTDRPADADADNWVARFVPARLRPYAELARLDRPIGGWLLFWPCLWGLALAAAPQNIYPPPGLIGLFLLGAFVMRGAGCTFNDIADRHIDGQVARTAGRPLPSGRVSLIQAWAFLLAQALIGLVVLLQFNVTTIIIGLSSLVPVAIYPFMKRITYWPQLFLGIAFNWGALVGYTSLAGQLDLPALALYAAGIFWTLGYDTIYAHQDREDDALVGVKSSALKLGTKTRPAVLFFYAVSLACLGLAGVWGGVGVLFWAGLAIAGWQLAMQVYQLDIDDPARCLRIFKSNRDAGFVIAGAYILGIF